MEAGVCERRELCSMVRQIANRRRVWWARWASRKDAEFLMIADFITRNGGQFLLDTATNFPDEFSRRLYSRLDNRARQLFASEFGSQGRRSRAVDRQQLTGLDLSLMADLCSTDADPAKTAAFNEMREAVQNAIATVLNEFERAVIDHLFFQGDSLAATALFQTCTKPQVRRIRDSAIAKLKTELTNKGYDE